MLANRNQILLLNAFVRAEYLYLSLSAFQLAYFNDSIYFAYDRRRVGAACLEQFRNTGKAACNVSCLAGFSGYLYEYLARCDIISVVNKQMCERRDNVIA